MESGTIKVRNKLGKIAFLHRGILILGEEMTTLSMNR